MDDFTDVEILMIDDDPGDVHIVQEALTASKWPTKLTHMINPKEAVEYLRSDAPLPHLVLLDLNMPGMHGFEVLEEIRKHEATVHIPVVILTTSDSEQDVNNAYHKHANCYVSKPIKFDQFIDTIQQIESFWTRVAKIPRAT